MKDKNKKLILNKELRAKHMNRVEVLERVGILSFLPNTEIATTKQIAEFYGVESQVINSLVNLNKEEVFDAGIKKVSHQVLKDKYFGLAGSTKEWIELRTRLGIATSLTNLHSKRAVLLIGFLLEGSEVAEKVRKLVLEDIVTTPVTVIEGGTMGTIALPNNTMPTVVVEPTVQKQQNDMVIIENNQAVTTSIQVAVTFGKRHDHVLRDIEAILEGLPKIGDTPMFHESTYEHPQNKQQYRMFYMNRDGFTLLAMGFTGKKAMQFKLKYIEQFNQMEEQLKSVAPIASYMIADPIQRAEMWISEQKEKMLLETKVQEQVEVIEHKQEVIVTLTEDIPIAEKRQFLNKVIRKGCNNNYRLITNKWNLLYEQFEMKYHFNLKVRKANFEEKTGKSITYLDFIEKHLNMYDELHELAMKLFERDVNSILSEYKKVLATN